MNVQKLTLKSQEALQTAQEIASSYNNQALEPIHLLAALAQDTAGIVPSMLLKLGANTTILKIKINEALEHLPKVSGLTQHYLSNDLNAVFDEALKEANALKDEYIAAEHILNCSFGKPQPCRTIAPRSKCTQRYYTSHFKRVSRLSACDQSKCRRLLSSTATLWTYLERRSAQR
jgi:ATP-dependent Clp protease ATP-binding subunit ClpA